MDFNEILKLLREPGENGVPEDIADQLEAAYTQTVDGFTENVTTLSEQLAQETAAREKAETARETALAHNQRLLKALPVGRPPENSADQGQDNDPPEPSINDLFTHK